MDLLMMRLDPDIIRLVGRCQINMLLLPLKVTAKGFAHGPAIQMLQHGNYAFIPITHDGL